jgi:inosose dehydratase
MTAKIAGAPISWGVCEVPGWGHQMSQERVLTEMTELGYSACEFGPLGFLPIDPAGRVAVLKQHGLSAVGGFVPVVLHDAGHDPEPEIRAELEAFRAAGAEVMVLAASTGLEGYEERPELTDAQWDTLFRNLTTLKAVAAEYGVLAVIHPHVGTVVESGDDVARVLAGTDVGFCLDTGHMLIGGADPVAFARDHADRIKHVHAKDVNLELANRVKSGDISYHDGVVAGMYVPLGKGNVDVAAIVASLEAAGFSGWYVLEQDHVVSGEPADGAGPFADAKESVTYLRSLLGE